MITTRKTKATKKNGKSGDLVQQFTQPIARWTGNQMVGAVRGIVSAYQQRGGGRQEMASAIAPLAQTLRKTSGTPKFATMNGVVTITHTEALPILTTNSSLTISTDTFQWLSNIASGFEEYKIKLEFGYIPICPATSTGSVMMAWDYDPEDNRVYSDYTDFFNTADHCVGAIWAPAAISPRESGWLKTGTTGERRLYSPGAFKHMITSTTAGYMMARYTVQLRKTQPNEGAYYAVYNGMFTTNTALTFNPSLIAGSPDLLTINASGWTQRASGRLLVIWSTDTNVTSIFTDMVVRCY